MRKRKQPPPAPCPRRDDVRHLDRTLLVFNSLIEVLAAADAERERRAGPLSAEQVGERGYIHFSTIIEKAADDCWRELGYYVRANLTPLRAAKGGADVR
jgi:hypothetical protein